LGYASRVYRRHSALQDCQGVYVQPAPPYYTRGAALFPIEGDRWILTLAGYGRDYPTTDEPGFLEFARSLRSGRVYDAIKNAEPESQIFSYRATENRLRHYERVSRRPEGFVVLGDAACAFNPVYAQGVTMAALGAQTLDQCLKKQKRVRRNGDMTGLARRFQRKLAKVNSAPWMLATGEDFRVRGCDGHRPGHTDQLVRSYVDRVVALSTENARARRLLLQVFNMLKPPSALFHPGLVARVLVHSLKTIVSLLPASANKADDRNEQSRSDDRPYDREALAPERHRKQMRQMKRIGNPHSNDCADEAQGDRYQTPAMTVARNGAAN
jgi:hypothetical protein